MRPSLITLTAALALLANAAFAGGLGEMTDAERTAFRAEVKQYLLENPEAIMEAMQVLQDRQDKTAADRDQQMLSENSAAIFNDPDSWVGGNPDGDVTVVEFMDYRCSYCRKAFAEVADLLKSDGNIRFVVKEFPILGEDSMTSARFAIAVRMLHGDDAYAKYRGHQPARLGLGEYEIGNPTEAPRRHPTANDKGQRQSPILARGWIGATETHRYQNAQR